VFNVTFRPGKSAARKRKLPKPKLVRKNLQALVGDAIAVGGVARTKKRNRFQVGIVVARPAGQRLTVVSPTAGSSPSMPGVRAIASHAGRRSIAGNSPSSARVTVRVAGAQRGRAPVVRVQQRGTLTDGEILARCQERSKNFAALAKAARFLLNVKTEEQEEGDRLSARWYFQMFCQPPGNPKRSAIEDPLAGPRSGCTIDPLNLASPTILVEIRDCREGFDVIRADSNGPGNNMTFMSVGNPAQSAIPINGNAQIAFLPATAGQAIVEVGLANRTDDAQVEFTLFVPSGPDVTHRDTYPPMFVPPSLP
jgi:hypothetical protein